MEILFLGTGAGEMWPATFCTCRRCAKARQEGNIMPGTSALIDGQYLIDAPNGLGLNLALMRVTPRFPFHVFITHSHQDHLSPSELLSTMNGPGHRVLLYMNRTTRSLLRHYTKFNRFFDLAKYPNYQVTTVRPFQTVKIGKSESVIPVLADHDTTYNEQPLNYILKLHGKTVLYACDTGWYSDRTWAEVTKHRFDVVILECTNVGTKTKGRNHLDAVHFLQFIEVLKRHGCLTPETLTVATHFAWHHYDRAKAASLEKKGILLAYRGMRLKC